MNKYEKLRKKRTNVDFSKHILNERITGDLKIWDLKRTNSDFIHRVKFINIDNIMAVKGDFGNWIFCREFHPSKDGFVSDSYWIEKAKIYSEQCLKDFDYEETVILIKELIKDESRGWEEDELSFLKECLEHLDNNDDELSYDYHIATYAPNSWDWEEQLKVKKTKKYLEIVFDAFEEVCRRLK